MPILAITPAGAWTALGLAILLEIAGTTLLKMSDGFEKPLYGGLSILAFSLCFWVYAPALKVIPVGAAYAIWSGVGILAVALIGAFFFKQQLSLSQYGFIALILIGAIGLRLTATDGA